MQEVPISNSTRKSDQKPIFLKNRNHNYTCSPQLLESSYFYFKACALVRIFSFCFSWSNLSTQYTIHYRYYQQY